MQHFVHRYSRECNKPVDELSPEILTALREYGWPGNVRELRNALARAITLAHKPGEAPARFADLVFNLGPASREPSTIGLQPLHDHPPF